MNKQNKGFTLVELLVVIAVIALLMAILLPALNKAREQGKRAVCMIQIKQLQIAWSLYADDNEDKIVSGDTIYSWGFPSSAGGKQGSWFEYPHTWNSLASASGGSMDIAASGSISTKADSGICPLKTVGYLPSDPKSSTYINIDNASEADWHHSITDGKFWKYIEDFKVYRCPVGEKNAYVTNYMSHSMHTHPDSPGPGAPMILSKSQIKRTAERFVLLDVGLVKGGGGAYYTPFKSGGSTSTPQKWYDPPPTRHGMGTVFSFADNHSEYRKWTDPHAIDATEHGWGGAGWPDAIDNCDCDLRWFNVATWGMLSSDWTSCPGKGCDY